jgi:predicted nucleic acid-binding protein
MMYALDSNIVTYALKSANVIRQRMYEVTAAGHDLIIPHIVYFEIKRWLLEIGAKTKLAEFERMLYGGLALEQLDKAVWDVAAVLYVRSRKAGQPMGDADLLIAAFCIANDYTLVTNNTRYFAGVIGLSFVNWKE